MIRLGLVYTGVTPQLIQLVEKEIHRVIGEDIEILNYKDPSIIAEARANGYVTSAAAIRLYKLFLDAAADNVDAILNICSSVGETADSAQNMAKYIGIPIVRIDEEMCKVAVRKSARIGVIATLATTMEPTKNTLMRVAREIDRHPFLVDGLIENGFDLNESEFKEAMLAKANEIKDSVDIIVLCQGSMAYCEKYIQENTGVETLSSPRFGASALKVALQNLGKLED